MPGSLFADPTTGTLSVSPTTVAAGYDVTYTMTFSNYTVGGPYYFQLSTGTNSREYGPIDTATEVRQDFFAAPGLYTAELLVYTMGAGPEPVLSRSCTFLQPLFRR